MKLKLDERVCALLYFMFLHIYMRKNLLSFDLCTCGSGPFCYIFHFNVACCLRRVILLRRFFVKEFVWRIFWKFAFLWYNDPCLAASLFYPFYLRAKPKDYIHTFIHDIILDTHFMLLKIYISKLNHVKLFWCILRCYNKYLYHR